MQLSPLPVYGQTMSAAPSRKQSEEEGIEIASAEREVCISGKAFCNKYFTGFFAKGANALTLEVLS